MITQGIRILDNDDGFVTVRLIQILEEITERDTIKWSILYMDAIGDLGEGKSIVDFSNKINQSEVGFLISWLDLNSLAKKLFDVIDIIIIGSSNEDFLHRYDDDQEMYETCNFVIEMFDSWFWEVFSKDNQLINRLASKFNETKFLESDFVK